MTEYISLVSEIIRKTALMGLLNVSKSWHDRHGRVSVQEVYQGLLPLLRRKMVEVQAEHLMAVYEASKAEEEAGRTKLLGRARRERDFAAVSMNVLGFSARVEELMSSMVADWDRSGHPQITPESVGL